MIRFQDCSYNSIDGTHVYGLQLTIETAHTPIDYIDYVTFVYHRSEIAARAEMRSRLMKLYAEIGEAIETLRLGAEK